MSPALPVPNVSTLIVPLPLIFIFSGAVMLISPPLPSPKVEPEIFPWLKKLIIKFGLLAKGLIVKFPALAILSVSAKMPNSPLIFNWLVFKVMFPASPVALLRLLALNSAFSPMVKIGVVMSIFPAFPPAWVSTLKKLPLSIVTDSDTLKLRFPASPSPSVKAMMPELLIKFKVWLLGILILPPLPLPEVIAVMVALSRLMLLLLRLILPASRLLVVEAVICDACKKRLSLLIIMLAGWAVKRSPSPLISVEIVELLVILTWLAWFSPLLIKILPGLPSPVVKAWILLLSKLKLLPVKLILPASRLLVVDAVICDEVKERFSLLIVMLAGWAEKRSPSPLISVEIVELLVILTWLAWFSPLLIKILPGFPSPEVKAWIVALSILMRFPVKVMSWESPKLDVDADKVMPSLRLISLLSIKILPASPLPAVSTRIIPSPERLIVLGANKFIFPASPLPEVEALILTPSLRLIWLSALIKILPALPLLLVSTCRLPLPVRLIISLPVISISPALPPPDVEAEICPFSKKLICKVRLLSRGWIIILPASPSPNVSAKIPLSPKIVKLLVVNWILPAFPVAFSVLLALNSAFSPIVIWLAVNWISPASSSPSVSTVKVVPLSIKISSPILRLILPASPSPLVKALIVTPSLIFSCWELKLISPAFPVPKVSTLIVPLPCKLMVWGALILISPPSPALVVEAEICPSSKNVISKLGLSLGLMFKLPASATPSVSANIPNSPVISRKLAKILMLPASPVALMVVLALNSESLPMVNLSVVMSIFPASPLLSVCTFNRLLLSMVTLSVVVMIISPALPSPKVAADICELSLTVRIGVLMTIPSELPLAPSLTSEVIWAWFVKFIDSVALRVIKPAFPAEFVDVVILVESETVKLAVSKLIFPALPSPDVSAVIEPSPLISMFSGAVRVILPPSPMFVVRAEIKPFSVNWMLRLGLVW